MYFATCLLAFELMKNEVIPELTDNIDLKD